MAGCGRQASFPGRARAAGMACLRAGCPPRNGLVVNGRRRCPRECGPAGRAAQATAAARSPDDGCLTSGRPRLPRREVEQQLLPAAMAFGRRQVGGRAVDRIARSHRSIACPCRPRYPPRRIATDDPPRGPAFRPRMPTPRSMLRSQQPIPTGAYWGLRFTEKAQPRFETWPLPAQ